MMQSPSMRREWIEIQKEKLLSVPDESPSMRREWIEMLLTLTSQLFFMVSFHAEGVD